MFKGLKYLPIDIVIYLVIYVVAVYGIIVPLFDTDSIEMLEYSTIWYLFHSYFIDVRLKYLETSERGYPPP